MAKQLVEVYKDCPIYYVTPPDVSSAIFRSPCITGDYVKLSAVKKRIDALVPDEPPVVYEWEFIESYRGHAIYLLHPDEDYYTAWEGTQYGPYTYKECKFAIDLYVDGQLPPEPPDEPHVVETYRDIEIWYYPNADQYRATIEGIASVFGATRQEVRDKIDIVLDWMEPPIDPPDGFFAQVVAALKTWIQQYMPGWVAEWGQILYTTVNNIYESITNIYNNITEYVTNVYNNTYEYITRVYKTFNEYIMNVYQDFHEYVTNIYNNTYNYITNVIGVTSAWVDARLVDMAAYVDSRIALLDPTNFLTDPPTYISGIFSILGLAKEMKMIESFLAGLEEGLEE